MNRLSHLVVVLMLAASARAVELDSGGCRVLSKLPEPGVHPRVFFTSDEYSQMGQRLAEPSFKGYFGPTHLQTIRRVRERWGDFAEADLSNPSDETILRYFTSSEGRNIDWGVASVTAVLTEDEELMELMRGVIVNYAHLILASQQRAMDEDLSQATPQLRDRLRIW